MTSVFCLSIEPPREGIGDLHAVLLQHPRIRDAYSELVYVYWVKADITAGDLAALIEATVPGAAFFVTRLFPDSIAGVISDRALAWFERPPPPLRGDGHQPDQEAIGRLPAVEILERSAQEARLAALAFTEPKGAA